MPLTEQSFLVNVNKKSQSTVLYSFALNAQTERPTMFSEVDRRPITTGYTEDFYTSSLKEDGPNPLLIVTIGCNAAFSTMLPSQFSVEGLLS